MFDAFPIVRIDPLANIIPGCTISALVPALKAGYVCSACGSYCSLNAADVPC